MSRIALIAAVLAAAGGAASAQDAAPTTECPAVGSIEAPVFAEEHPEGYLECIEAEERLAQIQELGGRWAECYEAQDAVCMADLYDPNAILVFGGGMPLRGSATIEAYFAGLFRACEDGESTAVTLAYDSIDAREDTAVIVQQWRVVVSGASEDAERSGRALLVLRPDDRGAWRIWRQMDDAAMAPPAEDCPAIL